MNRRGGLAELGTRNRGGRNLIGMGLCKRIDNVGVTPDVVVESGAEQLRTALDLLFKHAPSFQQK